MRYLGGKSRIARRLVDAMMPWLAARSVWEPFCGGLAVGAELARRGVAVQCSDANEALITMYQAVASGWDPPSTVSEAEFLAWRDLGPSDPRKAFARFGCSFGGNWGSGYARPDESNNYASQTRNVLLRDVGAIVKSGGRFVHADFLNFEPLPTRTVLYLDPPYIGTTGYAAVGAFDHERFYDRVANWSTGARVFVSEYTMPWGRVAWEVSHDLHMGQGAAERRARVDRLYHYGPDRMLDGVRA